ncbi:hypothetical protein U0070_006518, partial [Myodes glareolus]
IICKTGRRRNDNEAAPESSSVGYFPWEAKVAKPRREEDGDKSLETGQKKEAKSWGKDAMTRVKNPLITCYFSGPAQMERERRGEERREMDVPHIFVYRSFKGKTDQMFTSFEKGAPTLPGTHLVDSRVLLQLWQLRTQRQGKRNSGGCRRPVLAGDIGGAGEWRGICKVTILSSLLLGQLAQTPGRLLGNTALPRLSKVSQQLRGIGNAAVPDRDGGERPLVDVGELRQHHSGSGENAEYSECGADALAVIVACIGLLNQRALYEGEDSTCLETDSDEGAGSLLQTGKSCFVCDLSRQAAVGTSGYVQMKCYHDERVALASAAILSPCKCLGQSSSGNVKEIHMFHSGREHGCICETSSSQTETGMFQDTPVEKNAADIIMANGGLLRAGCHPQGPEETVDQDVELVHVLRLSFHHAQLQGLLTFVPEKNNKVIVTSKHNKDTQHILGLDSNQFSVTAGPRGHTQGQGTTIVFVSKEVASDYFELDKTKNLLQSSSTFPCTWWNSKTETINEPKAEVEVAKEENKELDVEAAVEEEEGKKAKMLRKLKNLYGMGLGNY